jgi:hypothetical protein
MSVRTRIVLGTLCTFNALLLVVIGAIALGFVDGRAGPVGAASFWTAAASLLLLARRLRRDSEW